MIKVTRIGNRQIRKEKNNFFANKAEGSTNVPVFLEPSRYVLHPESSQDASPELKTNTNQ